MINQVIVFENNNKISVISPSDKILTKKTIEEIESDLVPEGADSMIVDSAIIPTDRKDRNSWIVDFENKTINVNNVEKLARLKKDKKQQVKDRYKSESARKVIYNNNIVLVNEKSVQGIDSKRQRVEDNNDIDDIIWFFDDVDENGERIETATKLDTTQARGLHKQIADRDQYLRKLKYVHCININNLTTIEEVESYDIEQPITDSFTELTDATWD